MISRSRRIAKRLTQSYLSSESAAHLIIFLMVAFLRKVRAAMMHGMTLLKQVDVGSPNRNASLGYWSGQLSGPPSPLF